MKARVIFNIVIIMLASVNLNCQDNRIEFNGKKVFLNGANIAWINFGADVGPGKTDFEGFKDIFIRARENGGNCMRLWLHTNGSVTPEFEGSAVTGPGDSTISDIRQILNLAYEQDLGLILCLWSFDMLRKKLADSILMRNKALLTVNSHTESYIQNALIPMVDSLKGNHGIIAWEIFNEPEGMCSDVTWGGWDFNEHISVIDVQRFVNKCAAAIHHTDPAAKVTNGIWSLIAGTDVEGYTNYYTDGRLIAAGSEKDGVLDFYTLHHYDWLDKSPFMHPCGYWKWDKPVVIAEFFPQCKNCGPFSNYEYLYENGYAGALGWDWYGKSGDQIRKEMKYLYSKHPRDISIGNHSDNTK